MATRSDGNPFLVIMLATVLLSILSPSAAAEDRCPEPGSIAPEIGPCRWLQKDKDHPTEIGKLRGEVVLVHTFAYGCDP